MWVPRRLEKPGEVPPGGARGQRQPGEPRAKGWRDGAGRRTSFESVGEAAKARREEPAPQVKGASRPASATGEARSSKMVEDGGRYGSGETARS